MVYWRGNLKIVVLLCINYSHQNIFTIPGIQMAGIKWESYFKQFYDIFVQGTNGLLYIIKKIVNAN